MLKNEININLVNENSDIIKYCIKPKDYELLLKYFLNNVTLKDLANIYGVSYQCIQQKINKSIIKIKVRIKEINKINNSKENIVPLNEFCDMQISTRLYNIISQNNLLSLSNFKKYNLIDILSFKGMSINLLKELLDVLVCKSINIVEIIKDDKCNKFILENFESSKTSQLLVDNYYKYINPRIKR